MLAFDFISTLAVAGLTLVLGGWLWRKLAWARRYHVPKPVLGGLVVSAVVLLTRQRGVPLVHFDTLLQTPLMVAFFTALGTGASWSLLKRGGPLVILFLGACTLVAVAQNLLGVGLCTLMGINPLLGIMAGSVTLTGGPGTALAFASLFEAQGLPAAHTLALTAAMAGMVMGGILASPVATWLLEHHRLIPTRGIEPLAPAALAAPSPPRQLLKHGLLLLVCMALGGYVSQGMTFLNVRLPSYMGGMLVAAVMRNVDDGTGWLDLDEAALERWASVALSLFLAMSLMTLNLAELQSVALPLLAILLAQAVLVVLLATTVMFWMCGRNYEGAVMSAGFVGFMLGTTANAMAAMDAVTHQHGPAPQAYLVVPVVGACFIDFTNSILITVSLHLMGGPG